MLHVNILLLQIFTFFDILRKSSIFLGFFIRPLMFIAHFSSCKCADCRLKAELHIKYKIIIQLTLVFCARGILFWELIKFHRYEIVWNNLSHNSRLCNMIKIINISVFFHCVINTITFLTSFNCFLRKSLGLLASLNLKSYASNINNGLGRNCFPYTKNISHPVYAKWRSERTMTEKEILQMNGMNVLVGTCCIEFLICIAVIIFSVPFFYEKTCLIFLNNVYNKQLLKINSW